MLTIEYKRAIIIALLYIGNFINANNLIYNPMRGILKKKVSSYNGIKDLFLN